MSRRRPRLFLVADRIQDRSAKPEQDDPARGSARSMAAASRPTLRERAQALFDHRRSRTRWFGEQASALPESGWDILLELFLCHEDGRRPSTTSVAYGAGVPITTALRSLRKLEGVGLVESHMDKDDTRVRRIAMTADAVRMMRGYLGDV